MIKIIQKVYRNSCTQRGEKERTHPKYAASISNVRRYVPKQQVGRMRDRFAKVYHTKSSRIDIRKSPLGLLILSFMPPYT